MESVISLYLILEVTYHPFYWHTGQTWYNVGGDCTRELEDP